MISHAVWSSGQYTPIECTDPNLFYSYIGRHFPKKNVTEAMKLYGDMCLKVRHPLDLLRVVAQVCVQISDPKYHLFGIIIRLQS